MSTDKHTVPPSPDLCACGHGRAMHFDEDGDHNGPCLWQVHSDAPFCKCDMWHRKPGEDEFLGVPVSEWNQIAAEINCRRGPDGSLLKRFRELLEVSDMRAALLKKRSAQGVDVEAVIEHVRSEYKRECWGTLLPELESVLRRALARETGGV